MKEKELRDYRWNSRKAALPMKKMPDKPA